MKKIKEKKHWLIKSGGEKKAEINTAIKKKNFRFVHK
jgi:hypothetical protein